MGDAAAHSVTDGHRAPPSGADPLVRYRERFPILARTNYLISNSLGAAPATVATSLHSYYEAWATRGVRAWEDSWWTLAADLGDLVAPLIGAREGEIVFQPNVTLAHAVIFSAIPFWKKSNRIVTDAMHFPSILYLIEEQRKNAAVVDVVPSADGITVDTQRVIDRIEERTAIVSLSHVLFKSAYVHDIAAITAKAKSVQALTVIDGYQAVGTIPIDVRALGIDIYVGGCLKWLCGGPGAAFLWVDPEVRRLLEPKLTGWMAHQRPFGFEPVQDRRKDAWRLLHGTPSIPALYAAKPGLQVVNEVGIDAIREKSQRQTKRLLELADREGYPCTTPRDPSRRGGTVAINIENAHEISQSLKALDILCDYRPGAGIRFSPHFYNLDAELDAAIDAIREIRATGALASLHDRSSKGHVKRQTESGHASAIDNPTAARENGFDDAIHRIGAQRATGYRMRRKILEWTLWLSITAFLGVISLEAAAFLVPRSQSSLALGQRFFAVLRPGWIDLASGLETTHGPPVPAIVNPRNIVWPKVTRSGSVNLPGVSLTFCLFQHGPAVWSMRISLLVPLVLSLFMIAIVFYRLKLLHGRSAPRQSAVASYPASPP